MLFLLFLYVFTFNANSLKISKNLKALVDYYLQPEDPVKAKLVDGSWEITYRNLMPLDDDFVFGEKTIAIEKASNRSWGVAACFGTIPFQIIRIFPGKQFENLGVTIGWKITKINGVPLCETNREEFECLLVKGAPCTLTFKSDDSKFALLQHQRTKELVLRSLKYDETYEEYITNVQILLEQKQWHNAISYLHSDYSTKVPTNLQKTLQHNLVDFFGEGMLPKTSLLEAIWQNDIAFAKNLISQGATVGTMAIEYAICGGSVECTKLLLEVNPNVVNARDDYNVSPLFNALYNGYRIECASLLIKYGVNLKAKDENDGHTALEVAKELGRKEYVKILTLAELVQKANKKECWEKFKQNN